MKSESLISAANLHELIRQDDVVVVDCRFDLSDPAKGRADWFEGHVPGAQYAHLDNDLSAPVQTDSGRHPLPDGADFAGFLAGLGWNEGSLLVAYDHGSGAIAGRLWWLMRYFGQPAKLLDGGIAAWSEAGLRLESGEVKPGRQSVVPLQGQADLTVNTEYILSRLGSPGLTVLDARAAERFSGEIEPLDTKAGHIPGALNRDMTLNVTADGRFKPAPELRREFEVLLDGRDPATVVHSCGSGVTACHNLFAMEMAGLNGSRLYPGSWSEWIRDDARPVAVGTGP